MKLFKWFDDDYPFHSLESNINPASGLPMMEDSCFDIAGNPFGADFTSAPDFDVGASTSIGFGFDD